MTDPAVVAVLASIALGMTAATQALRAMYYDGKLEKLQDKMSSWLNEVDDELGKELKSHPTKERVIEIAAKFSAVKSMQKRVQDIQDENASSIKNTNFVYGFIAVSSILNLNLFSVDPTLVAVVTVIGFALVAANLYSAYRFQNEYNNLEGRHKAKKA